MKAIPRFGVVTTLILLASTSAQAGWRKRVVIVQPTTVVTPASAYQWSTSNGAIVESRYNMIPAEPIGTSAPPLPVVAGYVPTTVQKVKVVSPRRVYRYYSY